MWTPLKYLVNLVNVLLTASQKFDYPTAELPTDFKAGPNIRQARSGIGNDLFESQDKPVPFVTTDVGNFEGYFMKVISGRDIYAFQGIPYAEPPQRFHDPIPKSRFEGNFSAKSPQSDCSQVYIGTVIGGRWIFGDEDCLQCNVYSPHISSDRGNPNLPVIFNIYGGAFFSGSSKDYGPAYLLEQDIVLVACNYRVGALGFLSTGDAAAPGNWGLKDLALALDWTHKHIRNFGGDPDRIVVMGESAGAVLGHLLMMSPPVKDKIFGAVLVSGNAFVPWAVMDSELALRMTWRLAVINFCPTNQGSLKVIECLRRRNGLILEVNQNFLYATEQWAFKFSPVIEPDVPGALITRTPEEHYKEGLVANIPVLFSQNSNDADVVNIFIKLFTYWPLISRPGVGVYPQSLGYAGKVKNEDEVTRKIIKFYGGIEKISENSDTIFEAGNERYFTGGFRKSLRLHSQIAPTYAYIFAYRSQRGLARKILLNPYDFRTPHAEDLFYVFNRTDIPPISRSHPDFGVVRFFQTIFSHFAQDGHPLYTDEDGVDRSVMQLVSPPPSKSFKMLIVDQVLRTVDIPWENNITRFWDSLNIREFPSLYPRT